MKSAALFRSVPERLRARFLMQPFEIIEHPADVGLKIRGPDLRSLFVNAANGLYSLMTETETLSGAPQKEVHTLELAAAGSEDLLFEWLRELLFLFSARLWVLTSLRIVELSGTRLKADSHINFFDPARDEPRLEVKAVTYHQFYLRRTDTAWEAGVIFDI